MLQTSDPRRSSFVPNNTVAAKDSLERVTQARIMLTVEWEPPLDQDLGTAFKIELLDFADAWPKWRAQESQAALAEWNSVLRMANDLETKAPLPSRLDEGAVWQPPNRKPAKDERPGTE